MKDSGFKLNKEKVFGTIICYYSDTWIRNLFGGGQFRTKRKSGKYRQLK